MQSALVVRFGAFELNPHARELRKHGLKIKLQDQPFQILVMLLEQPGQVVTREQLHQKLWPEGTFVDFEHGLNAAIQRLRQALGDTAENPRFVETVARCGSRFVAPVNSGNATQIEPIATQGKTRQWMWAGA
jgi:DNA-binding winged helix-turn-helix (wHTH) protein